MITSLLCCNLNFDLLILFVAFAPKARRTIRLLKMADIVTKATRVAKWAKGISYQNHFWLTLVFAGISLRTHFGLSSYQTMVCVQRLASLSYSPVFSTREVVNCNLLATLLHG